MLSSGINDQGGYHRGTRARGLLAEAYPRLPKFSHVTFPAYIDLGGYLYTGSLSIDRSAPRKEGELQFLRLTI